MRSGIFDEQYKNLNAAQKLAVDSIEGPVMVVAGPGTGKTQILTFRIARILQETDTAPEQILALTFTEAGASAMRERLVSVIGETAYRVPIPTFHGFAGEVIGRFPEYFADLAGSRPCGELDRIILTQKVIDGTELKLLASPRSPYHYLQKVLSAVSLLKREAISPQDLSAQLDKEERSIKQAPDYRHEKGAYKGKVKGEYLKREEDVAKNRELAKLYEAYEKALAKAKLYDYDDMVLCLVEALEKNRELRMILQEEYQYLLADEYQDGNGAQNKVLEILSSFHESPNIFVVGDEDQAIYRFQGASHENFVKYKKKYPDAKIIELTDNYRSTQNILDASRALGHGVSLDTPCPSGLMAKKETGKNLINVLEANTISDEADTVAEEIKNKIKSGVKEERIAVFTRTNAELATYSAALTRMGIPVSVETKEDVLDDEHIEKLLILIKAANGVGEDFDLVRALHLDCFNVDELEIYELAREMSKKRQSVWKLPAKGEIARVRGLILSWAKLGANVGPAELVSTILRESGILAQILAHPDAENKLDKVSRILKYLEEYLRSNRSARLEEVVSVLELLDEYNVLESRAVSNKSGRVQLMTAHKAKGLEFERVYIVGVTDGNWGGRTSRTSFRLPGIVPSTKDEEEADEKHLFYVAMTRAKKELTISYAVARDDGKVLLPSRFIMDIPEHLLHKTALCSSAQGSLVQRAEQILVPERRPKNFEEFRSDMRTAFLERGLAVTGLNNYLSCPWKYFYRNLLRIPEPQTVPLMFGNAVHRTLKRFFDRYSRHEDMGKSELLSVVDQELSKEFFTDKELKQVKEDGRKALAGYYDFYKNSWPRDIKSEFAVDVLLTIDGQDIRLTGKLDKIEVIDGARVNVVDYKTGKAKSRNEILGNTKNSEGDYHRQLVFYKLLLDKYQDGRYRMQSGTIDFVTPEKRSSVCKREVFDIDERQVTELEVETKKVIKEILDLSFWDKRCGEKECEYCALRDILPSGKK